MPQALSTSSGLVQLTLSVYMLALGLGQLIFGSLSDRYGHRPVVLSGGALFSFASLGLGLAQNGTIFLSLRLRQAIGASAMLVATFATVRDLYAGQPQSTKIYALFSAILA